jgi:hypothetical protein
VDSTTRHASGHAIPIWATESVSILDSHPDSFIVPAPSQFYPECRGPAVEAVLLFYNRLYCEPIFEVCDGS